VEIEDARASRGLAIDGGGVAIEKTVPDVLEAGATVFPEARVVRSKASEEALEEGLALVCQNTVN
jgi:hypothetical protein